MITAIILGVGSLVGGALGWKLGRTYERVRGGKKAEESGKGKDKASR
jgi:membrane protein YqaA with SNARE-associated domain